MASWPHLPTFANHALPKRQVAARRTTRAAAPWDSLTENLPDDVTKNIPFLKKPQKIVLPATFELLQGELQETLLDVVEKAIPRIDIELPAGMRMGIEKAGKVAPLKTVSEGAARRGDRELAFIIGQMFCGLRNSRALSIAFNDPKVATIAKKGWRDTELLQVTSLPSENDANAMGVRKTVFDAGNRQFLLAVAPNREQLALLNELDKKRGGKMCIMVANGRLRGREEPDDLRDEFATASNPVFHLRFLKGKGVVYRRYGQPWIVARRVDTTEWQELKRFDDEPSAEEIREALK